jgi:hypothetical protein
MDLFFANSDDVPLPPDQVEIRELTADPLEDGKRVNVTFELTPFQQRPNIEILVTNRDNKPVGSFSVVEAIDHKMSFTLHIREPKPQGTYQIDMQVFYTKMPPAEGDSEELIKDILLENKKVVATAQHRFEIPV